MNSQLSASTVGTPTLTMPNVFLRLEGLALFLGAVALYANLGGSWLMFALLLFVPDVGMLGYMANLRIGAVVYNLAHLSALPLILIVLAWTGGWMIGVQIGLIWLLHIWMDRVVGYGFKYSSGFKDTHLQRV